MEFIDPNHSLDIRDKTWRILAKNTVSPPHFFTDTANVKDSLVVDGCYVAGEITHSILSSDVQVKEGAQVIDSVIMPGATIGKNAHINRAIVGENAIIGDNAVVNGEEEIAVVGYSEVIGVSIDES